MKKIPTPKWNSTTILSTKISRHKNHSAIYYPYTHGTHIYGDEYCSRCSEYIPNVYQGVSISSNYVDHDNISVHCDIVYTRPTNINWTLGSYIITYTLVHNPHWSHGIENCISLSITLSIHSYPEVPTLHQRHITFAFISIHTTASYICDIHTR